MGKENKEYTEQFGQILRELRKSRNLTLYQAEEALGIDWKWLQKVETGKKNIYLSSLFEISIAYGVQPTELLRNLQLELNS